MSAADVVILVYNANGDNLLDPDFEGNILDNNITIEYEDEVYAIMTNNEEETATRALPPPEWYGLRLHYSERFDTHELLFGEFGRCLGNVITINWGDGTSDEVKFDFDVEYKGSGKKYRPYVYLRAWLNGELQSDDSLVVEIVK